MSARTKAAWPIDVATVAGAHGRWLRVCQGTLRDFHDTALGTHARMHEEAARAA